MNSILRHIIIAFAVLSSAACSGKFDPEAEVPEGVLRIFADKTTISADGDDEVTFTVKFGSEDVSNDETLQLVRIFDGSEKLMAFGANKFSTVTAGTYRFKAEYDCEGKHYSDNEVSVVAEPFFSGEEKSYKKKHLAVLFTSTGCNYCPVSSQGLKDLQAEFPGEIVAAAFHQDYKGIADPMSIAATEKFKSALGGVDGLPTFFWNMKKETVISGGANKVICLDSYDKEKKASVCYSGVAISTVYDEKSSKLDIEVGITSNKSSVFRCLVILAEDGIPGVGDYKQDGDGNMEDYIHNNVVRSVLTEPRGDRTNEDLPFTVGVEVRTKESVTLDSGWMAGNMRVIAASMTSEDGGYNWEVNNVAECKVGGSVEYLLAD